MGGFVCAIACCVSGPAFAGDVHVVHCGVGVELVACSYNEGDSLEAIAYNSVELQPGEASKLDCGGDKCRIKLSLSDPFLDALSVTAWALTLNPVGAVSIAKHIISAASGGHVIQCLGGKYVGEWHDVLYYLGGDNGMILHSGELDSEGNIKDCPLPPAVMLVLKDHDKHCIQKKNSDNDNGNPMHLWECGSDDDNENWSLDSDGYIRLSADGDKCMAVEYSDDRDDDPIHLWDCDGGTQDNKKWIYDTDSHHIKLQHDTSKCMQTNDDNDDNGNPIVLRDCDDGHSSQKEWMRAI